MTPTEQAYHAANLLEQAANEAAAFIPGVAEDDLADLRYYARKIRLTAESIDRAVEDL